MFNKHGISLYLFRDNYFDKSGAERDFPVMCVTFVENRKS